MMLKLTLNNRSLSLYHYQVRLVLDWWLNHKEWTSLSFTLHRVSLRVNNLVLTLEGLYSVFFAINNTICLIQWVHCTISLIYSRTEQAENIISQRVTVFFALFLRYLFRFSGPHSKRKAGLSFPVSVLDQKRSYLKMFSERKGK